MEHGETPLLELIVGARKLSPMRTLMLRFAGFTGAPILSALAPFIILPLITRVVGAEGWANFATGQSIGILGMVVVLFGWGIAGPVRVARSHSDAERSIILRESIRTRLLTSTIAVPAAAVATALISGPAFRIESILIAIAMTLGGLTPAWFCIGQGNPRALMLFDAAPKLAASLLALPIVAFTGQVVWYPLLLLAFTLPAVALHARHTYRHDDEHRTAARSSRAVLRTLAPTAAIDATGNAYGATAIPIATAGLSASDASAFASADRVYRIGIMAVIAFGNAFQAWVLEPAATDRRTRHVIALIAHAGLGLAGGAAIALLGPWATAVLFGPAVAAEPIACALFGLAFFFLSTATPLIRNLLIPEHRYRTVLAATITAAVVGLTTMIAGSSIASAPVIALGVAASEGAALLVLAVPALRVFRMEATHAPRPTPNVTPPVEPTS